MRSFLSTLKVQFVLFAALNVLLLFTALFVSSAAIRSQALNARVMELVDRTDLVAGRLITQNRQYLANMPGDFASYYRDVKLFYADQQTSMDMMQDAMEEIVPLCRGVEGGVGAWFAQQENSVLPDLLLLQGRLSDFRTAVEQRLGSKTEPQLHQSAAYISINGPGLQRATRRVLGKLKEMSSANTVDLQRLNQLLLIGVMLVWLGGWLWFWRKAACPLDAAIQGVRRVRQGNFGIQVPVRVDNEIGTLLRAFNEHSQRLDCIFRLLDKLQRGLDLDDTLRYVSEEFSRLVPIDWVGVFFPTSHGQSIQLRCAYADGTVRAPTAEQFPLRHGLLERAMRSGEPLCVEEVGEVAAGGTDHPLLSLLVGQGIKSAVLLPLAGESDVAGILVVACRGKAAYGAEEISLLANIAHLVTQSFANTVRMISQRRLALIGEYVAAIVHEIRNPLTSIRLAAAHFAGSQQDKAGSSYAGLLQRESVRMQHLLDEVLTQAQPLELNPACVDLAECVRGFHTEHEGECNRAGHPLTIGELPAARVLFDPDRFSQVMLNLLKNALESALPDSPISMDLQVLENSARLRMVNAAEPIDSAILEDAFEPFMTTKTAGTGLGLSIVKRLVNGHGGEVKLENTDDGHVVATLMLPLADSALMG